jgi:hypothetical protein
VDLDPVGAIAVVVVQGDVVVGHELADHDLTTGQGGIEGDGPGAAVEDPPGIRGVGDSMRGGPRQDHVAGGKRFEPEEVLAWAGFGRVQGRGSVGEQIDGIDAGDGAIEEHLHFGQGADGGAGFGNQGQDLWRAWDGFGGGSGFRRASRSGEAGQVKANDDEGGEKAMPQGIHGGVRE